METATAECPRCGKVLDHANMQSITVGNAIIGANYPGVSYVCPNPKCQNVFGVGIDPIAYKRQIIEELCDALGVKSKRTR